ncbi:MAG: alpha/beta fold hydrolase [Pleurocapsa sp.]
MNYSQSLKFLSDSEIYPERPLLIYLPGMDGAGRLFKSQAKKLAAYFDLRYLSIPTDNADNWQDLTRATIKLIESELLTNRRDRVYLCGESFGGCLALKIAVTKPSLIQGLVLVNPASSFNQRPILSFGINITGLMPDWLHPYSAVTLLPFLAQLNRIPQGDRRELIQAVKALPPKVVSWRLYLLQKFQIAPAQLADLNIPSLVIASAADRLLPSVEEGRKLVKTLPKAQMLVLPHSGHACLLETETDLEAIMKQYHFLPAKEKNRVF